MGTLLASASWSVLPHLSGLKETGQPMPALLLLLWSPRPAPSSFFHVAYLVFHLSSFVLLLVSFPLLGDPVVGSLASRPSFPAELQLFFSV